MNAFDNALMSAGVHNLNLIRVSSIVPKDCEFGPLPNLPVGALTPAVYSVAESTVGGEIISACIGAGIGEHGGTLFEYHHMGRADDAENVVRRMIEEGFDKRGWDLLDMFFSTAEHEVSNNGCAVSVALMLDSTVIDIEREVTK